ncbi:phenylalanine--tRNA ligase subunit beta [Kyrpidia spormannii]|uniref:Phenylalanine--tRNA ligase beta subunit n=1 Tax=Kyrpidia spormannii TaxID=2055160 RepID=A0A2K8N8Q4_9BACL|nr:phenylalanine--tRNA ligase subunit beta [Kyrpidia spormannii]ATY85495.1 phenylalanine--tRNA ligase subunit beta [Kyrpidia spormannii]
MKVSYRWLQEWIDLDDLSPEEVAELLTRHGVAVETVRQLNPGLSQVVVGEVLEVRPHPEADRLRVCRVDVGRGDPLQIVCGAPNAAPGMRVPTALVGATLPETTIGEAVFRGVASQGMLCSAKEIGMEVRLLPKDQTEGLYVLPPDSPIGKDIVDVLGWDDAVLELDLTPNRSDCLSMVGVAHELSAILDRPLKFPDWTEGGVAEGPSPVRITLETPLCRRYMAQVIEGARQASSPLWMQMRLLAAGIRPIDAIVDATNYVMLELGQPLHAFDFDQVKGGHIRVRTGHPGERLRTLDGVERTLDPSMIVIADEARAIGLAGVMGGENSEITASTTRIVLESAWFDPVSVRRTARHLGLRSEAGLRFEKGVNPEVLPLALARASRFITAHAGGRLVGAPVDKGDLHEDRKKIVLRPDKVNEWLGVKVEPGEMERIFERLGFAVDRWDMRTWQVEVPSRRRDISREIDLAEEVARLHGYDNIPATMPEGRVTAAGRTLPQRVRGAIRRFLTDLGFFEVWTYTLQNPSVIGRLNEGRSQEYLAVLHPMSEERTALRTTLLPGLLDAAAYNVRRDQREIAIYEIGRVFHPRGLPVTNLPDEREQVGALILGRFGPHGIGWEGRPADFYAAKGVTAAVLERLGVQADFVPGVREGLHPGRTAQIQVNGGKIGWVGALHPEVEERWGIPKGYYIELDMQGIVKGLPGATTYRPLPRYPGILRDLALLVPRERAAREVEAGIRESGGPWLENVELFDVYEGAQVPPGYKSLAFRLSYRAEERTLTDEEVNDALRRLIDTLRERGVQLRSE